MSHSSFAAEKPDTDPNVPVVELWSIDENLPAALDVAIYQNGRVWVRVGEGSIWGQLDARQVEPVVQALLERDGLKTTTTDSLARDLHRASLQSGLSCRIPGAGDCVILIRTGDDVFQVRAHATGVLEARFPECAALQEFICAQRRLENVRAIVMVGGTQAAERLALVARKRLAAAYGTELTVSPEDLAMVRSLSDGTRYCQFVIHDPAAPNAIAKVVSLIESPGEVPRVSVVPDEQQIQ